MLVLALFIIVGILQIEPSGSASSKSVDPYSSYMDCKYAFEEEVDTEIPEELRDMMALCERYPKIDYLFYSESTLIFSAVREDKSKVDVIKVARLKPSFRGVKKLGMHMNNAKKVTWELRDTINDIRDYHPIEIYAMLVLNGLGGKVPELYASYTFSASKSYVIAMDRIDSKDTVLERMSKQYISFSEGSAYLRELTQILIRMVDLGVIHLDLHFGNVYFIAGGSDVRVIDFDRVDFGVEHELAQPFRYGGVTLKIAQAPALKATPEFFFNNTPVYLNRISDGTFLYMPTRHAVFQIGALAYHSLMNRMPIPPQLYRSFFLLQTKLPIHARNVPPEVVDFVTNTTSVDYMNRMPLLDVLKHTFLNGLCD